MNIKNKKYKYIIYSLVILLLISLTSVYLSGCFRSGKKTEKMQRRITKELDLDTNQQSTLQSSIEQYQSLWEDSKDITEQMKDTIVAEVQKDTIDGEDLAKNLQEQVEQLNAMIPEYIDIFLKFHEILTPEQKKKMSKEVIEHYEERKKYRKKHRRNKQDNDN